MPQVKLKITKTDNSTLEVDRFSGLQTVESLTQSTPDASSIYYGTLANSGSAQIVDKDGDIKDLIEDGDIENSNTNVDLYIDDHLVQKHITTDSDYNEENIFSMQFTNKLEYWDKINYDGYPYPNTSKTAYEMLEDVLTKLGYSSNDINTMLGEQIIYGDNAAYGTIKSYLQLITIPYPYLPSDTYRNTIDKFCRLAQLQVYVPDNSDLPKFVSARPIIKSSQTSNAIVVPKYAQLNKFNNTVILKNKYNAVEIQSTKVNDEIDYDTIIHNKIITSFDGLETNNKNSSKGQLKSYGASLYIPPVSISGSSQSGYYEVDARATGSYLENKYISGSFAIDATSPDGLKMIKEIYQYNSGGLKFSVTSNKKTKSVVKSYDFAGGNNTNNNFSFNISSVDWDSVSGDIVTETIPVTISTYGSNSDVDTSVSITDYSTATITYDDATDRFTINYTLLVCANSFSISGTYSGTSSIQPTVYSIFSTGTAIKRTPLEVNLTLYGDKREVKFDSESASDVVVSEDSVFRDTITSWEELGSDGDIVRYAFYPSDISNYSEFSKIYFGSEEHIINEIDAESEYFAFPFSIHSKLYSAVNNQSTQSIVFTSGIVPKAVANIQGSELLQTGTEYNNSIDMTTLIKNNIKDDYVNGISNGNIQLFCTDFFNSSDSNVLDFSTGSIIENNAVVSIIGDDRKWKVTGRKFNYDGQSTTNIEVEEVKSYSYYSVTFPSSVDVYNDSSTITSGSEFVNGTQLRVKFNVDIEGVTLNYIKINGQSVQDNSTFTLSSNTTITVSYSLPQFTVTFPDSISVYNGQSYILSGSSLDVGTVLTVRFVEYSATPNYIKVNGTSIEDGSTFTLSENTTITTSYEKTVQFDVSSLKLSSNSNTTTIALSSIDDDYMAYNSSTDGVKVEDFAIFVFETSRLSSDLLSGTLSVGSTSSVSGNVYVNESSTVGTVSIDRTNITITCSDTYFRGKTLTANSFSLMYTKTITE